MPKDQPANIVDWMKARDAEFAGHPSRGYSMDEIIVEVAHQKELLQALMADSRVRWGQWHYQSDPGPLLVYAPHGYEIELSRCETKLEVLDWLFHLNDKRWARGEVVGCFVAALKDLGYDGRNLPLK